MKLFSTVHLTARARQVIRAYVDTENRKPARFRKWGLEWINNDTLKVTDFERDGWTGEPVQNSQLVRVER